MTRHSIRLLIAVMGAILIVLAGISVIQLWAGPLYGPPPSPPPPPTGPIPTRGPTFDVKQLTTPPPPPTIVVDLSKYPTLPRPNPVTPAPEWATYYDPNFGFSFQYPSNWQIIAPIRPVATSLGGGTTITIQNYKELEHKGDKTADQLKIEIGLSSVPNQFSTLDNWVAQQKQATASTPEISYSPVEHTNVSNILAIRWSVKAPTVPQGNLFVAFKGEKWFYTINAYPATSKYISIFDRIVASFKSP